MRVRNAMAIAVTAAFLMPAAITLQAQIAPVLKKTAPPARGVVELGYARSFKVEGNTIVTTFNVKNLALGAVVGLTITEFWYDKAGNPIQGTGDRQRLRMPLQPGEVTSLTLRSAKVAGMTQPQYKFAHQYGDLKLKEMKELLKAKPVKQS